MGKKSASPRKEPASPKKEPDSPKKAASPRKEAVEKEEPAKKNEPETKEESPAKEAPAEKEKSTAPEKKGPAEKEASVEKKEPASPKKQEAASPKKKAPAEKEESAEKKGPAEKKETPAKKGTAEKEESASAVKKEAADKEGSVDKKGAAEKKETPAKKGTAEKEGPDASPWQFLKKPAAKRTGPKVSLGKVLPLIKRSVKCPGDEGIPKFQREQWEAQKGDKVVKKEPKLYVLMIPGAFDKVTAGWARMEFFAPSYLEFATFEWQSHGGRMKEPPPLSAWQLGADAFEVFREAILTGSYIIAGHSIGSNIASYISWRADHELGRPPLAMFQLDRPPLGTVKWTEPAVKLWKDHPMDFLKLNNPSVWKGVEDKLYDGVEDTAKMHIREEMFNQDYLPVERGDYKFPCKLFVLIAMSQPKADLHGIGPAPHDSEMAQMKLCKLTWSEWKLSQFEDWKKWCDKVFLTKIDTNHMLIKEHDSFTGVLYREAKSILKRAEKRA